MMLATSCRLRASGSSPCAHATSPPGVKSHWNCIHAGTALGQLFNVDYTPSQFLWHKVQWRDVARSAQSGGGLGDEQGVDVAVFRFTLGIPGFEDRLIPRVVGAVGALLLFINHVFGTQPAPDAQVRAEYLVFALCALCVVVPEIEERLKEALPGRGRQSMAEKIPGATNGFVLGPTLSDAVKKELAWSSASLIKNTNTCGLMLVHNGRVVMARGALSTVNYTPKAAQKTLDAMTEGINALTLTLDITASSSSGTSVATAAAVDTLVAQQLYLVDRGAMSGAKATACSSIPEGARSVLVQSLTTSSKAGASYMLLYSERPRAWSDKERRWVAAVANKLGKFQL